MYWSLRGVFFVHYSRTAVESRKLIGHSGPVFSTSFNNDNSFLVSASADRTGTLRFFLGEWLMHYGELLLF